MKRLAALLLASCAAVPDEIHVTTSGSRFDYLGGDALKELQADEGESVGVAVTGVYKLRPQQVQLVDPVRRPPGLPQFDDAGIWAREAAGRTQAAATQRLEAAAGAAVDSAIAAVSPAPEPAESSRSWYWLLVPLGVLGCYLVILRRRR